MHVIEIDNDRKVIGAFISTMCWNKIPAFMHTQGSKLVVSFPNAADYEWCNIELTRLKRVIADQTRNEVEMLLGIGQDYTQEEQELLKEMERST